MEIGHKPFAFKGLTYNIFGILYAKRTQFRGVKDGTSKGWPCRKLARRQARPTQDQAAQTGAEWDGQTWKLDIACPPGAASGEWRVASGDAPSELEKLSSPPRPKTCAHEGKPLECSRKPLEKSYPARIRTWKNRTKTCCDTVSPPGNRACSLATRCASGKTTRRRKRRFGSAGPCTQGSRAERSDPRPRH